MNPEKLSRRKKQVLSLIRRGYTNLQIAQDCYLSRETVKTYCSDLYSLFNTDRAGLRTGKFFSEDTLFPIHLKCSSGNINKTFTINYPYGRKKTFVSKWTQAQENL
jgi:hypothetical protein